MSRPVHSLVTSPPVATSLSPWASLPGLRSYRLKPSDISVKTIVSTSLLLAQTDNVTQKSRKSQKKQLFP